MNFRLIVLLLVINCSISSCSDPEAENKKFNYQLDSLHFLLNSRDSTVNEMLTSFNEISRNLDSVTARQQQISLSVYGFRGDVSHSIKDKINNDIATINSIIEDNRRKIDLLNNKLQRSSARISEFSRMITDLNEEINRKNAESELLNKRLTELSVEVIHLQAYVDMLSKHSSSQAEMLATKDSAMHTAYYIVGRSRELREKKIIDKAGGILGLGATDKLNSEIDHKEFKKIHTLNVLQIPIQGKDPEVITSHPPGSYAISKEGPDSYTLKIGQPDQFWSTTKYLVISLK